MTSKPRAILFTLAACCLSLMLFRCAHQGTLTGGPEDIIPPSAVEADPPNRTVEFTAKKITITFDEFIQLKDPAKEIFMAPPPRVKPEFKAHGKDITVEFKEELKPNTTYTINFGNSLVDFTEANVLNNFEYVFSTGKVIDSLSIGGRVLNAFTLAPEPDIIAMVYTDDNDTLPLDSLPLRVNPKSASRTNKEGKFKINNLPPGRYLLIALQDLNNNYYFDLPNERFAFLDSLVTLSPPEKDSITAPEGDSNSVSPVMMVSIKEENPYELFMFEEVDSTQKLLGKKLIGKNRLQYIFRMPVDTLELSLVDYSPVRPDWNIREYSAKKDTIDFWLRAGLPDTIKVRMFAGDSIVDTSKFILTSSLRSLKQKSKVDDKLKVTANTYAGSFDIKKDLKLSLPGPIIKFDSTRMILKSSSDSIHPYLTFSDSIRRSVILHHTWKEGESYRIIMDDSAFTDESGLVNDSSVISFKVRLMTDYGILIITPEIPEGSGRYIIQLLNEKDAILSEKIVSLAVPIRFEFLLPAKYKLKAIHDRNKDGKWNTGDYKLKLLPEGVQFFPKEINIRANWDLQEEWKLKNN